MGLVCVQTSASRYASLLFFYFLGTLFSIVTKSQNFPARTFSTITRRLTGKRRSTARWVFALLGTTSPVKFSVLQRGTLPDTSSRGGTIANDRSKNINQRAIYPLLCPKLRILIRETDPFKLTMTKQPFMQWVEHKEKLKQIHKFDVCVFVQVKIQALFARKT